MDVFLTHTQAPHPTIAGTTAGARAAVEAQIRHLAAFVRSCRDAVGPAILLGDFNVDYYGHRDLYDLLVSTLGAPVDLEPAVQLDGRSRPLATSESDDFSISSFHPGHPSRAGDDGERFGSTAERLDYIFAFPGLLYAQNPASSRVVVEQWEPGRDMSDHYGVEGFIDVTTQFLPRDRPIVSVKVQPVEFRCLQTTSGPGDDEVVFTLTAKPALGMAASLTTSEVDDVEAGTAHAFDVAPFEFPDPQDGLDFTLEGRELDSLSADDSLGRARLSYSRDELAAVADRGPARVAFPLLRGDGSEYVFDLEITVDAPADAGRKPPHE